MREISLREPLEEDFVLFHGLQSDLDAVRMAAFGTLSLTPEALAERWRNNVATGKASVQKTVLVDGHPVGFAASFRHDDKLEVTYWIDRGFWGMGIATAALSELLKLSTERPIYACAAKDNAGSRRVLEKCGFAVCGEGRDFSNVRGKEIDVVFFSLP
jgi:RimJ/RimL family protein N-acetyltransferase